MTPRTLGTEDLEPVLTADLFAAADYYFDGVWSNVTEGERGLMTIMTEREGHWTAAELAGRLAETGDALAETLDLLRRHDVIVEEEAGLRFASELMRRWVLLPQ